MNAFYDTVLAAMSLRNSVIQRLAIRWANCFCRRAAKRFVTKKAQLKTAFALLDCGPSVLDRAALRGPFGDGPFQLKRLDDGAELISDLKRGDTPIKLQIPGLPE